MQLTDFGLSKQVDNSESSVDLTSHGAGTYWYLPPEVMSSQHDSIHINNKLDVWSVGIIFYQMLYGKRPFCEGLTQEQIWVSHNSTMLQQAKEGPQFPSTIKVSEHAKSFIKKCLTFDQADRPDVFQVCEDAYLIQELK